MAEFVPVPAFELVVFGGSGDLALRKLFPSLFHRFLDGQIPENSRIIGVARSEMSHEAFREMVKEAYGRLSGGDIDDPKLAEFLDHVFYAGIDASAEGQDWSLLASLLDDSHQKVRVFYLSTPPRVFAEICAQLKLHDLVHDEARVVLEKPIGRDGASAKEINDGVGKVFAEDRIYRIDHYLGKETVQNLLVLRFANSLFEPVWSRTAIDHVQITVAESIGVGTRGGYYDKSGALRDMVQNHMLQLLCLVAMEAPNSIDADAIRTEKIKVLNALKPLVGADVKTHTVRGQYQAGLADAERAPSYLEELGDPTSDTETYVAIHAEVANWRWAGVPFYLRTGKRLTARTSEIVVQFRPPPHDLFGSGETPNRLVLRLQPDEGVELSIQIKEPGPGGLRVKSVPLDLSYANTFTIRYPDAYERLLMDVVRGNLSLFMRRDEVEAAWRWCDGILEGWASTGHKCVPYTAGTDGPTAAVTMLDRDGRAWRELVNGRDGKAKS